MNMTPVSSTNIQSIGYEGDTLHVKFRDGSLYAYYSVPRGVYNALMSSSSKGGYLAAHIKNIYRYSKIG